jgi:hypothetical protein
MNTAEQGYNYLSQEIPQSTARLVFPVTSLVSLSLLSLIVIYQYIKNRRRRQESITTANFQPDKAPWFQSTSMEEGSLVSYDSFPVSACDILRPLSQTSPFPTSGTLAAIALAKQNERSASISNSPVTGTSTPETSGMVRKCVKMVQQMCEEDSEGVRTWKRVVVEYR